VCQSACLFRYSPGSPQAAAVAEVIARASDSVVDIQIDSACVSVSRSVRRADVGQYVSVNRVIVFLSTRVIGWSAKEKYLHFLICNLVNMVFSKL
jgi:hypothetical protein